MNLRTFSVAVVLAGSATASTSFGQANLLDADPNSATFNNPSFERPETDFVSPSATKWTLTGPRQFVEFPPFGTVLIVAGTGVFENPAGAGHINGADGTQLAYIFANTINDAETLQPVDHAFTQVTQHTFAAGEQYRLTVGIANASSPPPPDSVLTLALFAFDPGNPLITQDVASLPISNTGGQLNGISLTDFSATTPLIGGALVGKQIGMRISTHTDPQAPSATGQFDFDNVRLTLVPEPTGAGLLLGAGVLAAGTRRRRSR